MEVMTTNAFAFRNLKVSLASIWNKRLLQWRRSIVAFHVTTMCDQGDGYRNLEERTAAMYGVPYPSYTDSIMLLWNTGTYLPDLTVHNPQLHDMYHGSSFLYLEFFLNDMHIMPTT